MEYDTTNNLSKDPSDTELPPGKRKGVRYQLSLRKSQQHMHRSLHSLRRSQQGEQSQSDSQHSLHKQASRNDGSRERLHRKKEAAPATGPGFLATLFGRGEDSYDPYKHRNVPKPTTDLQTLAHVIKSSFGTGILAMPKAFTRAGMIGGIIGTILLGLLSILTIHLLVNATHALCVKHKIPMMSYREAFKSAVKSGPKCLRCFAPAAPYFVDVFIVVYQIGICIVYQIFLASNIKSIADNFTGSPLSLRVYILLVFPPLFILFLVRGLKNLSPFSMFANFLTLIGLLIIIGFLISTPPLDAEMMDFGDIMGFALYVGTTLFAFTNIGLILSFENNMKTPQNFLKLFGPVNVGMGTALVVYTIVGALGYSYCKANCGDVITLDLPQNGIGTSVRICMILAIFISYMIQGYGAVDTIFPFYVKPLLKTTDNAQANERKLVKAELILRAVLCIISLLFAFAIPQLGDVISLLGAVCLSAIAILFPTMMYGVQLYIQKRMTILTCTPVPLLIIIAGIAFATGTYASVTSIIDNFTIDFI